MPSYNMKNKNKRLRAKKKAKATKSRARVRTTKYAQKASQMALAYVRRRVSELTQKMESQPLTRGDLRDLAKAAGMKNREIGNQKDVPNPNLILLIAEREVMVRKPWREDG